MPLLTALVADTAHAVSEGQLDALCGSRVDEVTATPFPGGARVVCRECSRASAAASSSVPLGALGGRKRPGGM